MKQETYTHTIPLPEVLEAKGVIVGKSGTVGIVVKTSKRSNFGEIIYRLRYVCYNVLSDTRWTRDDLAEAGCLYIPRADVDASQVLYYGKSEM